MNMKFNLGLQLFASKKGVGSTKNGRDSQSKRLGIKRADGSICENRNNYLSSTWDEDSS